MIPLNITMESRAGVTVISNVFIDNYMKDANDAQIKIYLYMQRMAYDNLPTDISEIADKFNYTEKDVTRALKYWENEGLIGIRSDRGGNITGVIIKELNEIVGDRKIEADNTVISVVKENEENSFEDMDKKDYGKERDSITADDIRNLKDNPEIKMLINAGSAYFGRPLNPIEIRSVIYIYDRLGFDIDLASFLMEYCIESGRKSFDYIEQTAIDWYEEGADTVDKAKKLVKRGDKDAREILGYLGRKGNITAKELEYIRRWKGEYGMSMELIKEACDRAVVRTDTNRLGYTDRILEDWNKKSVKTLADVAKVDKAFEESRKAAAPKRMKKASGMDSSFEQRDMNQIDFDALEKALLSKKRI